MNVPALIGYMVSMMNVSVSIVANFTVVYKLIVQASVVII